MLQQVAGVGIHITHQHLMPIVADQFADIGQLTGTGARPQGQVHHHHHNGLGPLAETHQNRAPAGRPRQWVIFQQGRAQTTEDAIAVLGKTPEIAVELLVPVGEGPQMGQVFDLIDVARAQAAAIGLLQGHQVEIAEHVANPLQVAGAPRMGQQVLPAAGQVVVIALGADADLDIEAEQAQATVTGPVAGWRTSRVDLWVAQANGAAGGGGGGGARGGGEKAALICGSHRPTVRRAGRRRSIGAAAAYWAARSLPIRWSATCSTFCGPPALPMSKRYLPLTTITGTPLIW